MDSLELKEAEDTKYEFRPFSFQFTKAHEWDGALTDVRWLWPWVKPHAKRLFQVIVLFVGATIIYLLIPRLVAKIVDDVLVKKSEPFVLWGLLLASLMIIKIICDLSYKWIMTKIGQKISTQLRFDIFYQLGRSPLSFFDKNASGRLISRCVNDVTNLSSFFTANFFTVISDIVLIIGSAILLFTISVKSGLLVLIMLTPLSIFMMNVSQAQMRWGRSLRNTLSRLSSHTSDTMNNLAIMHSQPFTTKWSRRHRNIQELYSQLSIKNILTWGTFSSTHVLIMGLTYAMVISMGVHQLRNGEMSIGNLIATFTYVSLIFGPFLEISEKLNVMVTALGSVKRLRSLLSEKVEKDEISTTDSGTAPQGPITFKNISFSYRSDVTLFENFNLELPDGEVTALVGRTGSGKTTLAHLMLGLYPLQEGAIFWGDEDLSSFSTARRARWIGHVSQDLFTFSDTLRENLRLWREDITDAQIFERLERVGLTEKINKLPGKLDFIVKAETLPLSQGEKQLLLLCRALLQDPRLLVFDEATANLDQLTEEAWMKQVTELFQGRTTLFIAHRMETLRLASFVVVLENGKIKKTFRKKKGESVSEADL